MINQQTVELTTGKIVEANTKRIVIEINKNCYLNVVILPDHIHDMKVGEVVPILAILRITNGQVIKPSIQ